MVRFSVIIGNLLSAFSEVLHQCCTVRRTEEDLAFQAPPRGPLEQKGL